MKSRHATTLHVTLIAASILFVTALHFATPLDRITLHEIYQRLYYIPILAAAVLFGLRGGLGAAFFVSLSYLPHISLHWQHHNPTYALNQYAELVIFNSVGIVAGLLGDSSRNARARAEQSATELQKAYAELRQTFEQLIQADRLTALGELSAAVVHEVRNPLGSIKGAVEIMEDALPPDAPQREFAEIAKREVGRLDNLVGEFLRFARPPKPYIAPADVNEIVRSVTKPIEQRAVSQNVQISLQLSHLPLVSLDAEQIKQVLLNLMINALQAMPEGGRMLLRTNLHEQAQGSSIQIEVEDEGGGIDPSIANRVYDPFFTTKEKGVGLGLSIAYKIATQHGGSLTFAHGEQGAIFTLSIASNAQTSEDTI